MSIPTLGAHATINMIAGGFYTAPSDHGHGQLAWFVSN